MNNQKMSAEEARKYFETNNLPDRFGQKQKNNGGGTVRGTKKSKNTKLETECFMILDNAGIRYEKHPQIEVIPGFEFNGEKVHPMYVEPDAYLPDYDIYVDPKGYANFKGSALKHSDDKYKMLKWKFHQEGVKSQIRIFKNSGEFYDFVQDLANKKPRRKSEAIG